MSDIAVAAGSAAWRGGPGAVARAAGNRLDARRALLYLSPLTDDVVLEDPAPFENSAGVPLTLVFRHAGQVTIEASVATPGTP
jgi:hypothetical protein